MLSFKKKKVAPTSAKVYHEKVKPVLPTTQILVLKAVYDLNVPSNARMVETYMKWRGGSVTPRLSELCRKGWLKVAYEQHAMDGIKRKYYKPTSKGLLELRRRGYTK